MLPFKSIITIKEDSRLPLYNKIANSVIEAISKGTLRPGSRLPGSRSLSDMLGVHRKTVVAAYDELLAQGWIQTRGRAGTFVHDQLPAISKVSSASYSSLVPPLESKDRRDNHIRIRFDDGHPDIRLAPLHALAKEYSSLLKNNNFIQSLGYTTQFCGDIVLRQEICHHLIDTRGIYVDAEHILISRGSIMAFYLIINSFISEGEAVVVGAPGYISFNEIVKHRNGKLISVEVDQEGLKIDVIEKICEQQPVKFVLAISHHHHPTTVTLSAARRIRLIELSKKYNFKIIEDDYDYDFHYDSSPVLPLASLQHEGRVFYVGSFSKTVAPSFRLGFVVADPASIKRMADMRRYIDRTGDPVLERATAHLIKFGEIRRHLNKALRLYKKRRDLMSSLLKQYFPKDIFFEVPEGGMAIWITFAKHVNISKIISTANKNGLEITSPEYYQTERQTRFGFASLNEDEIKTGVEILKIAMEQSCNL
jgi:GntR family transcriptional regulator/MocR family aminotransferase